MNQQSTLAVLLRQRAAEGKPRISSDVAAFLLEVDEEVAYSLLSALARVPDSKVELRLEVMCTRAMCGSTVDVTEQFRASHGGPITLACDACGKTTTYTYERSFYVFEYMGEMEGGDGKQLPSPRTSNENQLAKPVADLTPERAADVRSLALRFGDSKVGEKLAEKLPDLAGTAVTGLASVAVGGLVLVGTGVTAIAAVVVAIVAWGPPAFLLPYFPGTAHDPPPISAPLPSPKSPNPVPPTELPPSR